MRGLLRARATRGMTYVELLVVATVAGVLATVAIPTGLLVHRAWEERQLKRSLHRIRLAIDAYHQDWEKGCIESDDEKGWPEDLEELTSEKELANDPLCTGEDEAGALVPPDPDAEPMVRRYLARIPPDPFNDDENPFDTAGWKARSYDDDFDSTSWDGEGLYDVYSGSELTSLDEKSRYSEW